MMPKVNWKITRLLAAVQDCAVSGADIWRHEVARDFDLGLGLAEARRQGLVRQSTAGRADRHHLTPAGWDRAAGSLARLAPLAAALAMRASAARGDAMMARHAAAHRAAELRVAPDA